MPPFNEYKRPEWESTFPRIFGNCLLGLKGNNPKWTVAEIKITNPTKYYFSEIYLEVFFWKLSYPFLSLTNFTILYLFRVHFLGYEGIKAIAESRLFVLSRGTGQPVSEAKAGYILGQCRKLMSCLFIKSQASCLLDRMGHLGEGAK